MLTEDLDGDSHEDLLVVSLGDDCGDPTAPLGIHEFHGSAAGISTSNDEFACEHMIVEFLGLPDPIRWTTEPTTNLRYRRATAAERADNEWSRSTYLVEAGSINTDASGGIATFELPIPEQDREIQVVEMNLMSSETGHRVIELSATTTASTVTSIIPTFGNYESEWAWNAAAAEYVLYGALLNMIVEDFRDRVIGYGYVERLNALGEEPGTRLDCEGPKDGVSLTTLPNGTGLGDGDLLVLSWSPGGGGLEDGLPPTEPNKYCDINHPHDCEPNVPCGPCSDDDGWDPDPPQLNVKNCGDTTNNDGDMQGEDQYDEFCKNAERLKVCLNSTLIDL